MRFGCEPWPTVEKKWRRNSPTVSLPVDPQTYALFVGVMLTLAFAPGPANLFAIATGLHSGTRAVIVGVAGMNIATLVWFSAAALGLGTLMHTFPVVFTVLRYLGAVYLGYLAFQAFQSAARNSDVAISARPGADGWSGFANGFAVQIANPKALLFFTAVLPPFLSTSHPAVPQLAMFAATTITADIIAMTAYGLTGGLIAARMAEPTFRRGFSITVGVLLSLATLLILFAH
jgi:threonine/homoserine/homoserine lactone efflux protein